MYKSSIVTSVQELRKQELTYSEICKRLNLKIPKGTLSYWCKNIKLSNKYYKRVSLLNQSNLSKGRSLALILNKEKQKLLFNAIHNKNTHLLNKIDINTQKLLLSILYLAEGYKGKINKKLELGNSDSAIIVFFIKLLKNCYNIQQNKLRARIQCRYDQDVQKLERYWIKTLRINQNQFYPTYKDKRTINQPTLKKDYKGVCTIYYGDSKIRLELDLLAADVVNKFI